MYDYHCWQYNNACDQLDHMGSFKMSKVTIAFTHLVLQYDAGQDLQTSFDPE